VSDADEKTAILVALGRIEGKIDTLNLSDKDHENRLRVIEKWKENFIGRWGIIGFLVVTAIGAAVALVVTLLERAFKHG